MFSGEFTCLWVYLIKKKCCARKKTDEDNEETEADVPLSPGGQLAE